MHSSWRSAQLMPEVAVLTKGREGGSRGAPDEARRGDWMVLFSAACFSTMPIFGTLAYAAGVRLVSLLAWRFLLSIVMLLGILAISRRFESISGRRILGLLGMGGIYLVMSFLYFSALRLAPVSTLTLLFYTYPAIVTLLAALLLRESVGRRKILALVLAMGG